MKDTTKKFMLIILAFVLMLIIPVCIGLFSEREAAREIAELGGEYHSVLPLSLESCGPVSGSDLAR